MWICSYNILHTAQQLIIRSIVTFVQIVKCWSSKNEYKVVDFVFQLSLVHVSAWASCVHVWVCTLYLELFMTYKTKSQHQIFSPVFRVYCKRLTVAGCWPAVRHLCSGATMWEIVCLWDGKLPPNDDGWALPVFSTLAFWWTDLWDRKHGNLSQAWELVFWSIKLDSCRTAVSIHLVDLPSDHEPNAAIQ